MGDLADYCLEQRYWEQTGKVLRFASNVHLFCGIPLNGEMAQLTLQSAELEDDVEEESDDDWGGWDEVGNTNDLEEKVMSSLVPDAGSPRPDPGEMEATQAVAEIQRSKAEAAVGLPGKIQVWHSQTLTDQIKILVYGQSGVGKTVFAATAPDVLFLDADGGMMSVQRPVARWGITDWADLKEAHRYLRTPGHPFKTVVLDSLNAIQKLGMDSTVRSFPMKRTYDDLPTMSDWGKALDDFARLVRAFRALPMRVIYLCATKNREYDDERAEPQLSGKQTVSTLNQAMDVIAYLYVQERESGRKPDRIMAFDIANSITKDRTNRLPPTMIDPTWEKLESFWK